MQSKLSEGNRQWQRENHQSFPYCILWFTSDRLRLTYADTLDYFSVCGCYLVILRSTSCQFNSITSTSLQRHAHPQFWEANLAQNITQHFSVWYKNTRTEMQLCRGRGGGQTVQLEPRSVWELEKYGTKTICISFTIHANILHSWNVKQ